ncbi:MAG: TSUP family transporter [Acidimicrobiales bacterium]
MSMPIAIGTSLAIIVGNALVTLGFRGVDAVEWSIAVPFTVTMLIGSAVGSSLGHKLPPERSLRAFATLLVLVAVANGIAAGIALAG